MEHLRQTQHDGALSALIVGSDRLARERLKLILKKRTEGLNVDEVATPYGALRRILDKRPDLIIVDGAHPPAKDLSFLTQIPTGERPHIMVVSAEHRSEGSSQSSEHVIRTDEVSLPDALQRMRGLVTESRQESRIDRLLTALEQQIASRPPGRFLVRRGKSRILLDLREVLWVQADGNNVSFHTSSGVYTLRSTMTSIERRLTKPFYRIHRSTIVNAEAVREVQTDRAGATVVVLRDGTQLSSSTSYRDSVEAMLEDSTGF